MDIFHQVAEAMHHMHDRGFVHADMKPNNIMVIQRAWPRSSTSASRARRARSRSASRARPDYIAPEQVHRRAITPKTDIYNLGATMYWMLTRQHIPTALAKEDSLVGSVDDHMIEKPTPGDRAQPAHPPDASTS